MTAELTRPTLSELDLPQILGDAYGRVLVDGSWSAPRESATLEVIDPGTATAVGLIADATRADVDDAVAAARAAFDDRRWTGVTGEERAKVLWRIADLIDEHHDELTALECLDQGQPWAQLSGMVSGAATCFRHYAGLAASIYGVTSDVTSAGVPMHAYTRREPVGVAGLIVPWNAPLLMAAWKIAPMLAAGCTGILKPAEDTSLTALRLAQLVAEAGVPAGVLNVVTGRGHVTGAALAEHPDVDKIAFTGSTAVGKQLVIAAAGNLKRLTLELGGKSPFIVLADADLSIAIPGAARAILSNSGQTCSAGSRLVLADEVHDQVVEGLVKIASTIRSGYSTDQDVEMGPLISDKQLQRVLGYVETGIADGAGVATGGARLDQPGYFMQPTVLTDAPSESAVTREEIFGPVVVTTRFGDVDEAIAIANDTTFGLSSSLWTTDVRVAHAVTARIRAGRVGINVHSTGDYRLPTGGYRQSGWGREHGRDGLAPYLEDKSVFSTMVF